MSTVSPDLLAALRTQLAEGERVAWAQCPEPEALLQDPAPRRKGFWDAVVILGGGYATIGSIWMALRSGAWWWLTLPITLILLAVAAYLLVQARERRKLRAVLCTAYAVTPRRALILRTYPERGVESIELDQIAEVALINQGEYFGDLSFVRKSGGPALVFAGLIESKRAHTHVSQVLRDPKGADEQLAHSEAYLKAMRGMMRPAS